MHLGIVPSWLHFGSKKTNSQVIVAPIILYCLEKVTRLFSFTGAIPVSLGNCINLTTLVLYGNQLAGGWVGDAVYASASNFHKLFFLWQERSQFHWAVVLIWRFSNFSGTNSQVIAWPTTLHCLEFLTKSLFWQVCQIPSSLGNCTKLTKVWLEKNQLTGYFSIRHNLSPRKVTSLFLFYRKNSRFAWEMHQTDETPPPPKSTWR